MNSEDTMERRLRILQDTWKPSGDAMERLKTLTRDSGRTRVGKRILLANILLWILAILFIPGATCAAYEISAVLLEKVENAGLTQEEIQDLDSQLKEDQITDDRLRELHALQVNASGQTYGPDALGAELIEVVADDGQTGYIYRTDLEAIAADSLEEALQAPDSVVLDVYDKDGRRVIGTFTLQSN